MSIAVTPPVLRCAGLVTRLLAAALDMLIVLLLLGGVFVGAAAAGFLMSPLSFRWPAPPPTLSILVGLLLAVGYLTVGWAMTGRTGGAAVLGLRVLARSGGRLGWWRAGLRALLCVIFPVGLFWSAVSRGRRSVQDVVMRSVVVYDWHPLTADAVAALTTGRKARLGPSSDSGDAWGVWGNRVTTTVFEYVDVQGPGRLGARGARGARFTTRAR